MSHETITHVGADVAAPLPPSGLVAKVNADRSVDLSWKPVAGATGYGVNEFLAHPDDTFKEWVDGTRSRRGPLRGGRYRYGITARNAAGVSGMSALVDVQVGPGAAPPPQEHGSFSVGSGAPGQVLDLSRWYLTLPIRDPSGQDRQGPWDVYQSTGLKAFRHELFDVRNGAVEYVAVVDGVTTSGESGASRCELREMKGPSKNDKADWAFGTGRHTLTCTLSCDPTGASPRRECTVGQIHDEQGTPPIRLAVNMNSEPGFLSVFPRGQESRTLLTGLRRDTVFTYRIRVEDDQCRIWVAKGGVDALPSEPAATYEKSELRKSGGAVPGKSYFKAGAYNLSKLDGSGRSVVRHFRLDLD